MLTHADTLRQDVASLADAVRRALAHAQAIVPAPRERAFVRRAAGSSLAGVWRARRRRRGTARSRRAR